MDDSAVAPATVSLNIPAHVPLSHCQGVCGHYISHLLRRRRMCKHERVNDEREEVTDE